MFLLKLLFLILFPRFTHPQNEPVNYNIPVNQVDQNTSDEVRQLPTENIIKIPDVIKIPALVYHNITEIPQKVTKMNEQFYVTPEILDQQFLYLSQQGYTSLTYSDLKLIQEGKEKIPAKPVIITFDDGHESQYVNAYPLLKKYNLKAVFYVFTNALDHNKYLTWNQLQELQNNGMEIGDHTRFHWYLDKQPQDILVKEIKDTKDLLEQRLHTQIISIAYPFGKYNSQVIQEVKNSGYVYARALKHTILISKDNEFILGGFIVQNSLGALQKILSIMY